MTLEARPIARRMQSPGREMLLVEWFAPYDARQAIEAPINRPRHLAGPADGNLHLPLTDKRTSLLALANIIGYSSKPTMGSAKPGETFRIYLDGRRAQADLGWSAAVSLEQGLQLTVSYFREYEREL